MVQKILAALAASAGGGGPIKKFPLGNIDPERALAQIRPHVGLDPLALSSAEISFSLDQDGRQLLASGSQQKLEIVAAVVQSLRSSSAAADDRRPPVFRPHAVGTADLQTVVGVLQTLLANEEVRLAPDAKSNQIALLASEEVHALVDRTIQQLATADSIEFKTLPLGPIEPHYALGVLNAMFASTAGEAAHDPPKIDADPLSGRLFVRARSSQIAEIQRVLEQLGQPLHGGGPLRMLPYRGERGRRILQAAVQFWPHTERVLIMPSGDATHEQPLEQEINAEPRIEAGPVSFRQRTEPDPAATIRGQLTPQGILIQSDAIDALDRFEKHLRQIAGLEHTSQPRMVIYYLKHTTAGEADRLLRRLLDAESAVRPPVTILSSGGNVTPSGAWSSGAAMMIPDQRLNRMFVYGQESDLASIQRHLEVIDRENSIADVRTSGEPRVIRLDHARAESVAAVLRDAYAGRIGATAEERQQAAVQLQRLQQNMQSRRGEEGNQQPIVQTPAPDSSESPRMTLAIDKAGNSLIVTAPSQLADEVERLAMGLDRQAAQVVRVMAIKSTSPLHVRDTLGALLGDRVRTSSVSEGGAAGQ
jgi:type II secretory pathway component GspD/PulD (secretin)